MKFKLSICNSSQLLVFVLVLISSISISIAQNEALDDLFSRLKDAKEDTNKVDILQDICWEFGTENIDSALFYGKKSAFLSKKLKYSDGEAVSRRYIARSYNFFGDYERAIAQLKMALVVTPVLKNPTIKGNLHTDLGNNYDASGNFELASEHFYNALRIFKKIGDHEKLGTVKINLCYFY